MLGGQANHLKTVKKDISALFQDFYGVSYASEIIIGIINIQSVIHELNIPALHSLLDFICTCNSEQPLLKDAQES